MRLKASDLLVLLARVAIGGVLLYAGFMKAVGPSAEFSAILETYKIFPASMLSPLAMGLPYVEMWTGLFFLTGFCTRQAAFVSAVLFICFLSSISSALLRGIDLASCGCFGSDALSPKYTLLMDSIFLLLAAATFKIAKFPSPLSLDRTFPKI
jgi:uncharacterized membrane protein YphA (DoxX/SURF4 family)